ncbi:hypothetical protein [Stenotrophomonas sepilia]
MPQKLIDQTTIQPDGRPGDDAFTAFATCNENFQDAEQRLMALEAGGQDVEDLKVGLQQEEQLRNDADNALSQAIAAEVSARQNADTALGARLIGRNVLINGDFRVAQRGPSFPLAATARYALDRWLLWGAGSQIGGSQQNADVVALPNTLQNRPRNAFLVTVVSAAGANNFALLQQRIEDVRTLAGGTVTFSGWLWADTAKTVSIGFHQIFGSAASSSEPVAIPSQKVTLASQMWTYVQLVFALPSITGKTITENSNLRLNIWLDAGTNSDGATDGAGIGQKSGTYWFSQLQVEAGGIATGFDQRSEATELILCKRYHQKSLPVDVTPGPGVAQGFSVPAVAFSSVQARIGCMFPVEMRTTPGVTIYRGNESSSGSGNGVSLFNGSWSTSGNPASVVSTKSTGFVLDTAATFTMQQGMTYLAGFLWTADAEI